MKIEELQDEEMYVLVAPDGSIQISSLAHEYAMVIAFSELLAKSGMSEPVAKLFGKGFEIMPVKVTIKQNGDSESAFKKAKQKMKLQNL